jgi:CDP-diacylglycerol--glycerol-3-phosphate 3-phosphatidyltransferase
MTRDALQRAVRRVSEQLARPLARTGIDPNALTVTGFLVSIPTALAIATDRTVAGGILVLCTGAFDTLDGAVARLTGNGSKFGAFLDSTLDRWAEGIIFTGLAFLFAARGTQTELVLSVLTLIGSMLISYTRARAEGLGIDCNVGFLQRPERFLLIGVSLLGPAWLLSGGMWFLAVATQVTAIQRVFHVHGEIERGKSETLDD